MKVQILLADKGSSSPAQGTLNLLNVGWTQTFLQPSRVPGPPGGLLTPPHAVAIFFEVEPRRCNRPLEMVMDLVTADGEVVPLPGPAGPQPMSLRQQVTVMSPPGVAPGSPGVGNTLLEIFPGLPLAAGVYEWRVTLDDEHEEAWSARFVVQQPAQQGGLQFGPPPSPNG